MHIDSAPPCRLPASLVPSQDLIPSYARSNQRQISQSWIWRNTLWSAMPYTPWQDFVIRIYPAAATLGPVLYGTRYRGLAATVTNNVRSRCTACNTFHMMIPVGCCRSCVWQIDSLATIFRCSTLCNAMHLEDIHSFKALFVTLCPSHCPCHPWHRKIQSSLRRSCLSPTFESPVFSKQIVN
jgi:hypothetical protein